MNDREALTHQSQRDAGDAGGRAYGTEGEVMELALRPGDVNAVLVVFVNGSDEPTAEVKMNPGHVEQLYWACDRVLMAAGIGWQRWRHG